MMHNYVMAAVGILLTGFWLGVIAEATATCARTVVCSYPQTIIGDAVVLLAVVVFTARAVQAALIEGIEL